RRARRDLRPRRRPPHRGHARRAVPGRGAARCEGGGGRRQRRADRDFGSGFRGRAVFPRDRALHRAAGRVGDGGTHARPRARSRARLTMSTLALPDREGVTASLKHRYFLRLHMTFILTATFAAGLVTTRLLLAIHFNNLGA